MNGLPARGEVWWCELPAVGRRPVVVLSRDAAIPRLKRTLIGPCTTTIRGLPSEVLLDPDHDPVPRASAVNLDSVESVSLAMLVERLGRLGDDRMREICAALVVAAGGQPLFEISFSILNIGRYIEIRMMPTITPTPIIISGSMIEVSAPIDASTSSS